MSKVPKDLYLQLYSSSPAPKRDYHGLTITRDYITLNSWDISHGPHVFPRKVQVPTNEFIDDIYIQNDIKNLFGNHVFEYAMKIAKGNIYSLNTIPHQIFLRILKCLAAQDIIHLGQTSKIFFELCNTNIVWKIIYRKKVRRALTNQELSSAEKQTWRHLLKKKLNERIAHLKTNETKKPTKQRDREYVERYTKPIVHKKRPPPTEHVPKLNIDFKIDKDSTITFGKDQNDTLRSKLTSPPKEKKTVKILTPKTDKPKNPFKPDNEINNLNNRLNTTKKPEPISSTKKDIEKMKQISNENKKIISNLARMTSTIPSSETSSVSNKSSKIISMNKMSKTVSTPHLIDKSVLYKKMDDSTMIRQKSLSNLTKSPSLKDIGKQRTDIKLNIGPKNDLMKSGSVKELKTTGTRIRDSTKEEKSSQMLYKRKI